MPLLNRLKTWLHKSSLQITPKSKMGDAIKYSHNQWHKLIRYTEDGRLNVDNNRSESVIKPFVIGRKAWLFSNTAKGTKANGLVPFDYLTYCLLNCRNTDQKLISPTMEFE